MSVRRPRNRFSSNAGRIAAFLLYAISGHLSPVNAQATADLSFQSYFTNADGGKSSPASGGISLAFRDYFSGVGLLSGNLAGGSLEGAGLPGRNYLKLEGARWRQKKVEVVLGDFELLANPVNYYMPGITVPNFLATGAAVTLQDENHSYSIFAGNGYLMQGPRISFRTATGQKIIGASTKWRLGSRLTLGARVTRLTLDHAPVIGDHSATGLFDPISRSFLSSSNVTLQARWLVRETLEVFGEVAGTRSERSQIATSVDVRPVSVEAGITWKKSSYTARAVYLDQSADYLPLAGFYLGGRRGGIGEFKFRPVSWLDLFAGGSHLETTTSLTSAVTRESTQSYSVGLSATLPGKVTLNASLSAIDVFALPSSGEEVKSVTNSIATVGLARNFGRQTYRVSFSDLDVTTIGGQQKQRSTEFEDDVRFRGGSVGAAVRWQNQYETAGTSNNLAFRAFGNYNFRQLSVFASLEKGSDLVSRSLFTRSAISTSTFGVRGKLSRQWDVYVDAFRTRLLLNLNSESAFALSNQGILPTFLFANDHWTLYSSVTKHFSWNGGDVSGDLVSYTAKQMPVTGKIEGIISALHGADNRVAAQGIPVMVDHDRVEFTDATGHYRFADISEGHHTVEVDLRRLPIEYDIRGETNGFADVRANRLSRVDFEVSHLGQIEGTVQSTSGHPLATVTVRLEPGGYTTLTEANGKFSFDNLVEGSYVMSARGVEAQVSILDRTQQPVSLLIPEEIRQKPVRRIILYSAPPNLQQDPEQP